MSEGMGDPIRLSQLGRARRRTELVSQTGEPVSIVDDGGREVAVIIPATVPVTEALLEDLVRSGRWTAEAVEGVRWMIGRPQAAYSPSRNRFIIQP